MNPVLPEMAVPAIQYIFQSKVPGQYWRVGDFFGKIRKQLAISTKKYSGNTVRKK